MNNMMEKTNDIKLSIAFITHNRAKELIRAIESCIKYMVDKTEIIIWDNHSNKENKEAIQKYISEISLDLKYYYSESNLGVAGGRNAVWKLSKGEYVFFLDDDAVIATENFFSKICSFMDNHEDIAVATVNIWEPETGVSLNCKHKRKDNDLVLVLSFVGGAHIIRRTVFPKEYLYPSKLFFGSEELFASYILYGQGYKICELSDLTVLHFPSNINRCFGKDRDINIIINQYIIKKLTYPRILFPVISIMFKLRILKNGLIREDYKKLLSERYDPSERCGISIKVLLKLFKQFGLIPLL